MAQLAEDTKQAANDGWVATKDYGTKLQTEEYQNELKIKAAKGAYAAHQAGKKGMKAVKKFG